MRISDWSSDVCSSDLDEALDPGAELDLIDCLDAAIERDRGRDVLLRHSGNCDRWRRRRRRLLGLFLLAAGSEQQRAGDQGQEIGRASCRERVCPYVSISVVPVSLQKKTQNDL